MTCAPSPKTSSTLIPQVMQIEFPNCKLLPTGSLKPFHGFNVFGNNNYLRFSSSSRLLTTGLLKSKPLNKLINFDLSLFAGWYWGAITAGQAHAALQAASEGAFLIRDSSHPLYMLTLSVRTARGPTSIRIQYSGARFLLDSSSPARPSILSFPDVPSMVQYYVGPTRKVQKGKVEETHGVQPAQRTVQESTVVLKLKRALHKPQAFPSLQHLTRLTINRSTGCPDQLPLPRPLVRYLQDYPFHV
uniref:Cytokine-inducible SH2-containing protein n=1 Tax=Oncorhynchus tshawytscha TaxID=74940 RepID=A0AAZ3QTD6_ONCTS